MPERARSAATGTAATALHSDLVDVELSGADQLIGEESAPDLSMTEGALLNVALPADVRAAVHDLVSLHGHITDDGELERMGEVFSPDVVYDVSDLGGGELRGLDMLHEAALALGEGNPVGHHVTNIIVIPTDDAAEVHARSKGIGILTDGTCGSVVYEDVVRLGDEGWRITRRKVRARRAPLRR